MEDNWQLKSSRWNPRKPLDGGVAHKPFLNNYFFYWYKVFCLGGENNSSKALQQFGNLYTFLKNTLFSDGISTSTTGQSEQQKQMIGDWVIESSQ